MKNILHLTFLSFMVFTHLHLFAQAGDIKHLPTQDRTKIFLESSPVIISDNELLIFYTTNHKVELPHANIKNDTVYAVRSLDAGKNWELPVFVKKISTDDYDKDKPFYLSALKLSSGRILLCWSDWRAGRIIMSRSDDNGQTWSDTTQINGGGTIPPLQRRSLYNLNLGELIDGKIILSFNSEITGVTYYRVSNDMGETWSVDAYIFFDPQSSQPDLRDVSMIEIPGKGIIAFFEAFESSVHSGIYKKISTDSGETWSEIIPVIDSPAKEKRPRVLKISDEELWLVYQVEDTVEIFDSQNDIYYIQSFDGGETWGVPNRFTSYVGEDKFVNAANLDGNPFITFSSTRFTNIPQISFAKLGETVERFRPPYIKNVYATSDSLDKKNWLITANVIDDEKVISVNVSFEDGTSTELFDDGEHDDGDSLDNIFSNTILFNYLPLSNEDVIDVNKLTLPINNKGILADVRVEYTQNSVIKAMDNKGDKSELNTTLQNSLSVLATYEEGVYLFSGGFFLSGYSNGELWANGVASSNLIEDYLPGVVGSDKKDPVNKIYTIDKDDTPFGTSWQYWKDAVSLGAEFYDGDEDDNYNPVDKNWNGIWDSNEDMPLLLGDRTMWCVYNDAVPSNQRRLNEVEPRGIEIKQTIFAAGIDEVENVIFIKYSILNTGTVNDVLDTVYFGLWQDPDIGSYDNDFAGSDTLLSSSFTYSDTTDEIYGNDPPALFLTLLQGPITYTNKSIDTAYVMNGEQLGMEVISNAQNLDISSFVTFTNPFHEDISNLYELRNLMLGKDRVGQTIDPCNFVPGEVLGGIDCSEVNPLFWFSGDPVTDYGWLNINSSDKRTMLNVGPFQLEKGKPQEIIAAYIIGRGTDNINSITIARKNVVRAIQEYQSNFASMTYISPPPANPVTDYVLYYNYPNPFNPTTTIRFEIPQDGVVTIDIYDILGQKVRTILNEFQKADRYEISFNAVGLASGVYIYRMKVNDFIESKKMILLR